MRHVFKVLLLVLIANPQASGATLAFDTSASPSFSTGIGGTLGVKFSISQPIEVTAFGYFDAGANGVSSGQYVTGIFGSPVMLWNSSKSIIAQVVINNSAPHILGNATNASWRMVDLPSPIILEPGSYMIGALWGVDQVGSGPILSAPEITMEGFYHGGTLSYPTTPLAGRNLMTFQFNTIPEPSLLLLLFSGLVSVIGRRRRSR